jgi:hypothetical protein
MLVLISRSLAGMQPPRVRQAKPEARCPGTLADMREAWDVERIWFTNSTSGAIDRSRASELDEARFVQVPRPQDLLHPSPETLGPASRVRRRYADMG